MPNYEGLTVDEAIQVGLKELNLAREAVEIKVLAEGKKGFLGIGKKAALVSIEAISVAEVKGATKTESHLKPQVSEPVLETGAIGGQESHPFEKLNDTDATAELATYLTKITKELNAPAVVKVEEDGERIIFHLESDKAGMLIGKHGKVLNALQYLAQVFIHRMAESKLVVVVNVGDYRERREATLRRLANNTADKVLRTGQPVFLEPMPAFERKQIHAILTDNKDVKTHSEGDEPYRYLVVEINK